MDTAGRPNILFLNVGWMNHYAGPRRDDPTRGNFGWLLENLARSHGHECYNFADNKGSCYGCHAGYFNTDITRLGAQADSSSVNGVLVVWFSRDPKSTQAVIVGWYKNATVYRKFQKSDPKLARTVNGETISFKAKARFADCFLLSSPARQFSIPNRFQVNGGYGQNPNWYGLDDTFLDRVWRYIKSQEAQSNSNARPTQKRGAPHSTDHELRRLIEDTAIRVATEFYESPSGGSRKVESVESQALGWDLEATGLTDKLLVEVKGLGGENLVAELTPNEFEKMQGEKAQWVLFVVTGCTSSSPTPFEFRYMHDAERWETADGFVLEVERRVAAIVRTKL